MSNEDTLYLEEGKMILARADTGFFEPIVYNVEETSDGSVQGVEINKGSFFYDFIMFIRFSERKKITSGKNVGKYRNGFLELFQYVFAFKALGMADRMMAEKLIGVFSRQS